MEDRFLITGEIEGAVCIWDLVSEKMMVSIADHQGWTGSLSLLADTRLWCHTNKAGTHLHFHSGCDPIPYAVVDVKEIVSSVVLLASDVALVSTRSQKRVLLLHAKGFIVEIGKKTASIIGVSVNSGRVSGMGNSRVSLS
jgi:hypothetical protein